MPDSRDIDKLGSLIIQLAEEPHVIEEWGESIELPPPVEPEKPKIRTSPLKQEESQDKSYQQETQEEEITIDDMLSRLDEPSEPNEKEPPDHDVFAELGFEHPDNEAGAEEKEETAIPGLEDILGDESLPDMDFLPDEESIGEDELAASDKAPDFSDIESGGDLLDTQDIDAIFPEESSQDMQDTEISGLEGEDFSIPQELLSPIEGEEEEQSVEELPDEIDIFSSREEEAEEEQAAVEKDITDQDELPPSDDIFPSLDDVDRELSSGIEDDLDFSEDLPKEAETLEEVLDESDFSSLPDINDDIFSDTPAEEEEQPHPDIPDDFSMPDFDEEISEEELSPLEGVEEPSVAREEIESELPDFSFEETAEDNQPPDDFSVPDLSDISSDTQEVSFEEPLEIAPEDENFSMDEFTFEEGRDEFSVDSDTSSAESDFSLPPELDDESDINLDEDIEVDEFSLRDFGEHFGVVEEAHDEIPDLDDNLNPAMAVTAEAAESLPEAEFSLSEEEFEKLQKTLFSMPRNLKIEVERLVAEQKIGGEDLEKLIRMLVAGESLKTIAAYVGKLTGKRIRIPAGYEKKTGVAFEEEKNSFGYILRYRIFPIIRAILAGTLALAGFTFLIYQFVYKPIYAYSLYSDGYKDIQAEVYDSAMTKFDRAGRVWRYKSWHYKYAEAFTEHRQYSLAEEVYVKLLAAYPYDKKGILDYAYLESDKLARYEKADTILLSYLREKNFKDKEIHLARGDNFLRWADEGAKDEFLRYEDARKAYARVLEYHGNSDELTERMLKFFVHQEEKAVELNIADIDNLSHVKTLIDFILNNDVKLSSGELARAGGYLMDRKEMEKVRDTLFKAREIDDLVPEVPYQLARYFEIVDKPADMEKALIAAEKLFTSRQSLDRRATGQLVDTYLRLGLLMADKGEVLTAEDYYRKGIKRYENALESRILRKKASYGRIYSALADIYYYNSDKEDVALSLYLKAEDSFYKSPENDYKVGRLYYRAGNMDSALERFSLAYEVQRKNKAALFALANTLYMRKSYAAAEGYYRRLLDMLEKQKAGIGYLNVQEDPRHKALLGAIIHVENNLGVCLFRLSGGSEGSDKYREALIYLTDAQELFVNLYRDPASLERAGIKNLAFINQDIILHPTTDFIRLPLAIYAKLPPSLDDENL
ncbi:tetratricopeptide repeat protein [Spirochaetia bacterium 38H-sp]|uniref:Tetratricopeptide repeat protein n=1 Tax=Rarispira pelagica TaxID=3141764 RepID=A0ABU9U9J7_9SPIR